MITGNSVTPLEYTIPFRCKYAKRSDLDKQLSADLGSATRGALLYGPTGTGKTYAMMAAMSESASFHRGEMSYPPFFVDWPEYISDIDKYENNASFYGIKFDPMNRLFNYGGAIFVDDVGQEFSAISGFKFGKPESIFDQFINHRTGLDLPLWITTNLTLPAFQERYGDRALSRITEHCAVIELAGEDRRLA